MVSVRSNSSRNSGTDTLKWQKLSREEPVVEKLIMRILNYCFYRIYHLFKKGEDSFDAAVLSTIIFTILVTLYSFAISNLIKKMGIINDFNNTKLGAISYMVVVFIVGWFLFIKKKKYIEIENVFKDETQSARMWGNFFVVFSLIFSFVFTAFVAYYKN